MKAIEQLKNNAQITINTSSKYFSIAYLQGIQDVIRYLCRIEDINVEVAVKELAELFNILQDINNNS